MFHDMDMILTLLKNRGIILILFFMVVAITLVLLRQKMREYRSHTIYIGSETSAPITNFDLVNATGESFKLQDIMSTDSSTWIYFFSPNCGACKAINNQIEPKLSKNLIYASFAPISFLSTYKKKSGISAPLFSLHPKYTRIIGISTVPFLIKIDRRGYIIEKESNYKVILDRLTDITKSN